MAFSICLTIVVAVLGFFRLCELCARILMWLTESAGVTSQIAMGMACLAGVLAATEAVISAGAVMWLGAGSMGR